MTKNKYILSVSLTMKISYCLSDYLYRIDTNSSTGPCERYLVFYLMILSREVELSFSLKGLM